MKNSLYSSTYFTLKRITEIHRRLITNQLPKSKSLAKEFGVSSKTIQRDIKFMKETWELPISYNRLQGWLRI